MVDGVFIDNFFVLFALVFYSFLTVVYLLRAYDLSSLEWKLSPVFSFLLIPFTSLWVINLLLDNDSGRITTGLPIIAYLVYDLWYRIITKKKPHHHPDRWPVGLVIYVLLLLIGSVGLNWYGFLVSDFLGNILVFAFFIMMGTFGYYRYNYNKRKKTKKDGIDHDANLRTFQKFDHYTENRSLRLDLIHQRVLNSYNDVGQIRGGVHLLEVIFALVVAVHAGFIWGAIKIGSSISQEK